MAKAKSRNKRKPTGGSGLKIGRQFTDSRRRRDYAITAVVFVAGLAGLAAYLWWSAGNERDFLTLASEGKTALSKVRTEKSQGRGHLDPGTTHFYSSRFPTSGIHHRVPTEAGFYDAPQQPIQLVHAVEHGHIVIYYDRPGAEVLATLKRWVGLYSGHWDGIVVTPMPRLGEKIVLTAWTKHLDLTRFDAAAAAAFIDSYRGRGPEKPVR